MIKKNNYVNITHTVNKLLSIIKLMILFKHILFGYNGHRTGLGVAQSAPLHSLSYSRLLLFLFTRTFILIHSY